MQTSKEKQHFTLVFEGNIREFKGNPLKTETVFGTPVAVGVGNAFNEIERASGTKWFWRIVDAYGLADVPSDEEEALRLILKRGGFGPKVEPAKPARAERGPFLSDGRHYDSQGYCDNPGRGY